MISTPTPSRSSKQKSVISRSRQMSARSKKIAAGEREQRESSQHKVTRSGSTYGMVNPDCQRFIKRDLTHAEFTEVFHTSANEHTSICLCFSFITGSYVIIGFSFIANIALCVALLIQFILDVSSVIILTGVILFSVSVIGLFSGWYGIRKAQYNYISFLMITMVGEGLLGAVWIIINFMVNSAVPIAAVISFLVFCIINLYLASYISDLRKWLDMLNKQLMVFKAVEDEIESEMELALPHMAIMKTNETMVTMDLTDINYSELQLRYVSSRKLGMPA